MWVSSADKRQFLKWFLEKHKLKIADARILIEYILTQHHILDKLNFTDKINKSERNIIISSMNSDEIGFQFYNQQMRSDDVAKAMASIMNDPISKINLIIHFHGKLLDQRYTRLVGHSGLENIRRYEQFEKYSSKATEIIDKVMLENEINRTKQKIDEALDQKNEKMFSDLVKKLKELEAKLVG